MARRRGQRKGYLYPKGPSWMLRWYEYARGEDGLEKRIQVSQAIAPRKDPHTQKSITRKQAERIAWEQILSKLDQTVMFPASMMTVEKFIREKFTPQWVAQLKPAGRHHYGTAPDAANKKAGSGQLRVVCQALGGMQLRTVTTEIVQQAVSSRLAEGKSTQTAAHLRNTISAVFHHALAIGYYFGANPAAGVKMPPMRRRASHALTPGQAARVLARLPRSSDKPLYQLAYLSMTTSLNMAELSALKWSNVNLTANWEIREGEAIAPFCLVVREDLYMGELSSTKSQKRRRTVPLTVATVELLEQHKRAAAAAGQDDFVFQNSKGGPINEHNLRARELKPIAAELKLGFSLGWHTFRHTHATLAEQVDMGLSDRQAMMGHASAKMTLHYTHSDLERRRASLELIAGLIGGKTQ